MKNVEEVKKKSKRKEGRYGKPDRSINRTWKTACMKVRVENAEIHYIRHKAITDRVRSGYSLEFCTKRAYGHSTPPITKQ